MLTCSQFSVSLYKTVECQLSNSISFKYVYVFLVAAFLISFFLIQKKYIYFLENYSSSIPKGFPCSENCVHISDMVAYTDILARLRPHKLNKLNDRL